MPPDCPSSRKLAPWRPFLAGLALGTVVVLTIATALAHAPY